MKKLSLKNLKLEVSDLLQRNQLKNILGGQLILGNSGSCSATCLDKTTITCTGSTTSCNDAKGY
jgi:hypothetical protein